MNMLIILKRIQLITNTNYVLFLFLFVCYRDKFTDPEVNSLALHSQVCYLIPWLFTHRFVI